MSTEIYQPADIVREVRGDDLLGENIPQDLIDDIRVCKKYRNEQVEAAMEVLSLSGKLTEIRTSMAYIHDTKARRFNILMLLKDEEVIRRALSRAMDLEQSMNIRKRIKDIRHAS